MTPTFNLKQFIGNILVAGDDSTDHIKHSTEGAFGGKGALLVTQVKTTLAFVLPRMPNLVRQNKLQRMFFFNIMLTLQ